MGKALHPSPPSPLQTSLPPSPYQYYTFKACVRFSFSEVSKLWSMKERQKFFHFSIKRWNLFTLPLNLAGPMTALTKECGRSDAAPAFKRPGSFYFPLDNQALGASAAIKEVLLLSRRDHMAEIQGTSQQGDPRHRHIPLVGQLQPAPSHLRHPSGQEDATSDILSPADITWGRDEPTLFALSRTSELCSK